MKIHSVVALCAVAAALAVPAVMYAEPVHIAVPVHTIFGKIKTVKLSVRNDTGVSLELKVGDTLMTLDAGKKVALKLPVGTRIVANSATPHQAAGSLLTQVEAGWNDVTIAIR